MEVQIDVLTILNGHPLGEGFGFNGDVLDTNVLNLAVVLGILFYFGGDFLSSLLKNRKDTILKSLQDAEQRYQEALEQLAAAKAQLEGAQAKAEDIRLQGQKAAQDLANQLREAAAKDSARLDENKQMMLQLEEEKAFSQVCQEVIRLALAKTRLTLQDKLNPAMQRRVIDLNIALLGRLDTE
jgi:F-type H+-transporting ATPase subunit b